MAFKKKITGIWNKKANSSARENSPFHTLPCFSFLSTSLKLCPVPAWRTAWHFPLLEVFQLGMVNPSFPLRSARAHLYEDMSLAWLHKSILCQLWPAARAAGFELGENSQKDLEQEHYRVHLRHFFFSFNKWQTLHFIRAAQAGAGPTLAQHSPGLSSPFPLRFSPLLSPLLSSSSPPQVPLFCLIPSALLTFTSGIRKPPLISNLGLLPMACGW